jgi:hypothetical protein
MQKGNVERQDTVPRPITAPNVPVEKDVGACLFKNCAMNAKKAEQKKESGVQGYRADFIPHHRVHVPARLSECS